MFFFLYSGIRTLYGAKTHTSIHWLTNGSNALLLLYIHHYVMFSRGSRSKRIPTFSWEWTMRNFKIQMTPNWKKPCSEHTVCKYTFQIFYPPSAGLPQGKVSSVCDPGQSGNWGYASEPARASVHTPKSRPFHTCFIKFRRCARILPIVLYTI